jgi:hypothetical protein
LSGCVHPQFANDEDLDPTPPAPPEVTVTRDVQVGQEEVGADEAPPAPPSQVLVWSNVRLGRREPSLFRLGAGLGALGHIDLNPCHDHGLPAGYVHLHLTFRNTGRVVRAAVETPTAPPPEALGCIADAIESTMVPLFDGGDVHLSKSFYVADAPSVPPVQQPAAPAPPSFIARGAGGTPFTVGE